MPSTLQGGFAEARIQAATGADLAVSTLQIERQPGRDLGATRSAQLRLSVGWMRAGRSRICDGGFSWVECEDAMGWVFRVRPIVAELRESPRGPDTGYTYNGVFNTDANPSPKVELGMGTLPRDIGSVSLPVVIAGNAPINKLYATCQPGERHMEGHPADQSGVF